MRASEARRHDKRRARTTKAHLSTTPAGSSAAFDRLYVTPFLDQNLSMTVAGESGATEQTYWYHQDGLGSVRNLTDADGVVVNRYDYTAFGETYAPTTTTNVDQRYTYTGRSRNPVSGTYYMRYRTQDPVTGRFLSKDPYGYDGGINLYCYVDQLPTMNTDAFGLRPMSNPPKNMGQVSAMGGDWTGTEYESRSPTAQAQEQCKKICAAYDRFYVTEKDSTDVGLEKTIRKTASGWKTERERRGGHLYYYKYELPQDYWVKVQEKKTTFDCVCEEKTSLCGFTYYADVKTTAISANWLKRVGDRTWIGTVSGTQKEAASGKIY